MPVVLREGLPALIRRTVDENVRYWGHFRPLQRFLRDHAPLEWDSISRCRMNYRPLESQRRRGRYTIAPYYACHQLPYCILCTRAATNRRVHRALDQFHRCTPKGKLPRFIGMVQTAPLRDDGTGWGWAASRNVPTFGKVVWDTLRDYYPHDVGAIMSYQDFGERAFAKRHPHMDLTLNGWMLQDGKPVHTPLLDLTGNGHQKWNAHLTAHATRLQLDTEPGNLHVLVRSGIPAFRRILWYKMRELVDLRKLDYNRDKQVVYWRSYKDPSREAFAVNDFLAGLAEYRYRLKQWPHGEDEGMELHRRYGHLSKRSIRQAQKAMGGEPLPHGRHCPCSECGDWERVFLDDVDQATSNLKGKRLPDT